MIIINKQRFPGAGYEVGRLQLQKGDRVAIVRGPGYADTVTTLAEDHLVPGRRAISHGGAVSGPWRFQLGECSCQLLEEVAA